jgi:hypothetical protein
MEIETVRIRLKGLDKAADLYYPTLKMEVKFDESGLAEVPIHIAKKLLGPDYFGYELVGDKNIDKSKPTRSSKTESLKSQEEFLDKLKV